MTIYHFVCESHYVGAVLSKLFGQLGYDQNHVYRPSMEHFPRDVQQFMFWIRSRGNDNVVRFFCDVDESELLDSDAALASRRSSDSSDSRKEVELESAGHRKDVQYA